MKKKNKIIFCLLFTVIFVVTCSVSCFAETQNNYDYTSMQFGGITPDSVMYEAKTGNSDVFLATQTVQDSMTVNNDNSVQYFTGTCYNVIDQSYGSGTYPSAYITSFYPDPSVNGGYNSRQRTSTSSSYSGAYGAVLIYEASTWYSRDFETNTFIDFAFISPDLIPNDTHRLYVTARLVCDINGETSYLDTSYYVPVYDYSGPNSEYCHFRLYLNNLLAYMGVTFRNAPLDIYSFEITCTTESKFDDFFESVDSRLAWFDTYTNSYSINELPADFNDGRIIYEQVINSRNFSDLLDWLGDVMESVLTTELFAVGNISVTPAILLSTIVGLLLILMVLKFFAGG